MCLQCVTEAENLGEIVPGIALMRATNGCETWKAGQFGLVESNDPFYVFDITPRPDPVDGLTDEQLDALPKAEIDAMYQWLTDAELFARPMKLDPVLGWRLVEACRKVGYSMANDGDVGMWLFHWMGKYMQEATPEARRREAAEAEYDRRKRQQDMAKRLRQALAEKGLQFVSHQVGRDDEGAYVEAGYFDAENVVRTVKSYALRKEWDPWTDAMVARLAAAAGGDHG